MILFTLLSLAGSPQERAEAPAAEERVPVERVALPRGERRVPLFMELSRAGGEGSPPVLVLFHAARSGKAEYRPIVPRLVARGYHCLAVDLSCGGESRGVRNFTAKNARDAGRSPDYLDAIPDMLDALQWVREHHPDSKRIAWGSSYSASLALHVAATHPELVHGVVAFSPGEYFTAVGHGATWVQEQARSVACPVFVTSARAEEGEWKEIFAALPESTKTSFLPEGAGTHGSRALWPESAGNEAYWEAVEPFLARHFPVAKAAEER